MHKKPNLKKLKIRTTLTEYCLRIDIEQGKLITPLFSITKDGILDFSYFYNETDLNKLGIQTEQTEYGAVPVMEGLPTSAEHSRKLNEILRFINDIKDVFRGQ
jgi:hypothetical protein